MQRLWKNQGLCIMLLYLNRPDFMKSFVSFLLLAGCACAQMPTPLGRLDSLLMETGSSPLLPAPMPTVRPDNAIYRDHRDPKNILRATTDNMPVKTPDSAVHYTMLQAQMPALKPTRSLAPRRAAPRKR